MAQSKKAKKSASTATAKDYSIIIAPIVTEKTSMLGNGGNTVAFRVQKDMSKDEIKTAVQRIFGKDVVAVRTSNILGKPRQRTQRAGRTSSYKKAYVTLKAGQTIEVVEGA